MINDRDHVLDLSAAGKRNSLRSPSASTSGNGAKVPSMPKLNLGENMAAMNKMLAKHKAKPDPQQAEPLALNLLTKSRLSRSASLRGSVQGSVSGSAPGSVASRQSVLSAGGKGGHGTNTSLSDAKSAGKSKKDKKSTAQMAEEVEARNTEYEAGKLCSKRLKEVEELQDQMDHIARIIDRKRPNPLGSYTGKDFLKIFAVNNFALLIVGFFFSAAVYGVFPVGGSFSATNIQAEGLEVQSESGENNVVIASRVEDAKVTVAGPTSAGLTVGGLEMALAATGNLEWSNSARNIFSFTENEIGINAGALQGVDASRETLPAGERIVSVSAAGGAVSLGGSMFLLAQGLVGNGSMYVEPLPGRDVLVKPAGTGAFILAAETEFSPESVLRVGKDLLSSEPCARGLTGFMDPRTKVVEFGSVFNPVVVGINGDFVHEGDVSIEGGGLRMASGLLKVEKLDFARARLCSFLGESRLGSAASQNLTIQGQVQFIDTNGESYAYISPKGAGYIQARNLSVSNVTWLQSNVLLGGGNRDPVPGWVAQCDLQRRGGGSEMCATSSVYRLPRDPHEVTILAGDTHMVALDASGEVCIGELCLFDFSMGIEEDLGTPVCEEAATKEESGFYTGDSVQEDAANCQGVSNLEDSLECDSITTESGLPACMFGYIADNSTKVDPLGELRITGSVEFIDDRRRALGAISSAGRRFSTQGQLRVDKAADLAGSVIMTGKSDTHAALRVLGPTAVLAPVHVKADNVKVLDETRLGGSTDARQLEVTGALKVDWYDAAAAGVIEKAVANGIPIPNGTTLRPIRFYADAFHQKVWAHGSAMVNGSATFAQNVIMGQEGSLLVTEGAVRATHAVSVGGEVAVAPLVDHYMIWVNQSLNSTTLKNASADLNMTALLLQTTGFSADHPFVTIVPVFSRRKVNLTGSFAAQDLRIASRHNQTYMDIDPEQLFATWWLNNQTYSPMDFLSILRLGGNSDMGALSVSGLLRLAKTPTDNKTLLAANPKSGDVMVRESLTTRGRTTVRGAEFGPVHIYSYGFQTNNESVFNWTEQGDPRCYAVQEEFECDVARQWNKYECFSEWRQPTLDRVETCTKRFNATRVELALRVPLREIYKEVVFDGTAEGLTIYLEPPVLLRTTAMADTTVRSSLTVNDSALLSKTSILKDLTVGQSLNVSGSVNIQGHAEFHGQATIVGTVYGADVGNYLFEAVPGSAGYISTKGGLVVDGYAELWQNVTIGESPVDTVVVAATLKFNNSVVATNVIARSNFNATDVVTLNAGLKVRGTMTALDDVRLIGNLVFESEIYRTFFVESWRKTILSSGSFKAHQAAYVDGVVACPALRAGTLYVKELIGTSSSGALIEAVPVRNGGFRQPRVDEIEAISEAGINVDSVVIKDGTIDLTGKGNETLIRQGNETDLDTRLITMVNSGHASYMKNAKSSIAFFHTGHLDELLSAFDASDQSGAITVGTESNWNQFNATHDAFVSWHTTSQGSVGERLRIRANGDVVLNEGLGEMTAAHGHFTVRGDFHLVQIASIKKVVEVIDPSDPNIGNNTNGTGNLTVIVNATLGNETETEEPEEEEEEEVLDPAFLVPKTMQVVSTAGEVACTIAAAAHSNSILQLHSRAEDGLTVSKFDLAYSIATDADPGSDGQCATGLVDIGSVLRIHGSARELLNILSKAEQEQMQAHVTSHGSAVFCNTTSERCRLSLKSRDAVDIEVSSETEDAALILQNGWNRIAQISLGDAGRNGRNHTFDLRASPSHLCTDNFDWIDQWGTSDCAYYRERDPGCTQLYDVGQKQNCPMTCIRCPLGVPTPFFDILKDGQSYLHVEDRADMAYTELYGNIAFGYCEKRDQFQRCLTGGRPVTLTVLSAEDTSTIDVTSQSLSATLKIASGYTGAAGIRFKESNESSLIQMAKRGTEAKGYSLDFTDLDDNLLMSISTPRSLQAGDLFVAGSGRFGTDSLVPHTVKIISKHAARCNVVSAHANATFQLSAGLDQNASLSFATSKIQEIPAADVNSSVTYTPAIHSEFSFINEGTLLSLQHTSMNASDNISVTRRVFSLVSSGSNSSGQGDLSFYGDARFCSVNTTDGDCQVTVHSSDYAEVVVMSATSNASITVAPGINSAAAVELVAGNRSYIQSMRLQTDPATGAMFVSSGITRAPIFSLVRAPEIVGDPYIMHVEAVGNDTVDFVNSDNVSMVNKTEFLYDFYGYLKVPGNGAFGTNSEFGAALTVQSMNVSRIAIGSNESHENASAALAIVSNKNAALHLVCGSADDPQQSVYRIVAKTASSNDSAALVGGGGGDTDDSVMLSVESASQKMISVAPSTVPRSIRQHTVYRLSSMEFFCKVSFVRVVSKCDGHIEEPQTAWSTIFLRECKVPCYTNLMPWIQACGEYVNGFDEISTQQAHLITLQHIVCVDYYGPYTGPGSKVHLETLFLFHELEQTQGPFAINATHMFTDAWVVQTRTQEFITNETTGVMHIAPSVVIGEQGKHNQSRKVSVLSRGAATVSVQSSNATAILKVRAGREQLASVSFVSSNNMQMRQTLVVEALTNETVITTTAMRDAIVHTFQWATAGTGTLDLLGYSNRRKHKDGSLLLPTMADEPVYLMTVRDNGTVGTIELGGSGRFGMEAEPVCKNSLDESEDGACAAHIVAGYNCAGYFAAGNPYDGFCDLECGYCKSRSIEDSMNILDTVEARANLIAYFTEQLGLNSSSAKLIPSGVATCAAAGLGDFCQGGPSTATPRTGGRTNIRVTPPVAAISVPGGACRGASDPARWKFESVYYVSANKTVGNDTVEVILPTMDCPAGYNFSRLQSPADVWSVAASVDVAVAELNGYEMNKSTWLDDSGMAGTLSSAGGHRNFTSVTVHTADGKARLRAVSGNDSGAILSIAAGAPLPSVHQCLTLKAEANWNDFSFLQDLYTQAKNGSNTTDVPYIHLPFYNQTSAVSECRNYSSKLPQSILQLVCGGVSSINMAAHLTEAGMGTLRIESNTRDLLSISEIADVSGDPSGSYSLTMLGDASFGSKCPPNCNVSSVVHVLATQEASMGVISQTLDTEFTVAATEGRSAALHLRQANASIFTLQTTGSKIMLTHYVENIVTHTGKVPYPAVEQPAGLQSLLELNTDGVSLSGEVDCVNLEVSGSVTLGNDRGDATDVKGSIAQTELLVFPYPRSSNNTYNLTLVDPSEFPCTDGDISMYGGGQNCSAVYAGLIGAGKDCQSNLAASGFPSELAALCKVSCDACPGRETFSKIIMFLPSVNNNPTADPDEPVKILTSASKFSILTEVGSLTKGSITVGFGSINIKADVTTAGSGQLAAAGTMTVNGLTQVRGDSYLGGAIIAYYSFSSVAAYGTFTEEVPASEATKVVLLSEASVDKSSSIKSQFDPNIVEVTCPFGMYNADGSPCEEGQRIITIPDSTEDTEKQVMIIHYIYGSVNEVNQVHMHGSTSGEIESHPDNAIAPGRVGYLSVYNNLVKTTSIVLAQVANPGVGGIVVVQAVTMMSVDGGFTITVRNVDNVNAMQTTYTVSYVIFL